MDELIGNLWISPSITQQIVNNTSYYTFQAGSTITSSIFPTSFTTNFILTLSNLDLQTNHEIKIMVTKPDNSTAAYTNAIVKDNLQHLSPNDSISYSGTLDSIQIPTEGLCVYDAYVDEKKLASYKMLFLKERV